MPANDPDAQLLQSWNAAPSGTSLIQIWLASSLAESFQAFYATILKQMRIHPQSAMTAVDRVGAADRRKLSRLDRGRFLRLRAHVLAIGIGDFTAANAEYASAWKEFEEAKAGSEIPATGIGWINTLSQLSRFQEAQRVAIRTRARIPRHDRIRRARLDSNLGNVLILSGQFRAAAVQFRAARRTLRSIGYLSDAAIATNNLGHAHLMQGQLKHARRCFIEVEDHCREKEWALGTHARAGLAILDLMEGAWERGMKSLDRIVEELEGARDHRATAFILKQQAEFLCALGSLETADRFASRAYGLYRDLGLRSDAAHTAYLHGRILVALGRLIDGRVRLQTAREHWHTTDNCLARYRTETELGGVLLARGDAVEALALLRRAAPYLWRHDRRGYGVRARHLLAKTFLTLGNPGRAGRLAEEAYAEARSYPSRLDRPWIALTVARARASRNDVSMRWARRSVREMEKLYLALGTRAMRGQVSASREDIYRGVVQLVLSLGIDQGARVALDLLSRARSPQLVEDLLHEPEGLSKTLRTALARLRDEMLGLADPGPEDIRFIHLRRQMVELDRSLTERAARPPALVKRVLEARGFAHWSRHLAGRSLVFFDQIGRDWSAYVVDGSRKVSWVPLPAMAAAVETHWVPLRMLLEQAAHLPRKRRQRFLRETETEAIEALLALRQAIWDPLSLDPGEVLLVPAGDLHGMPIEALPFAGDSSRDVWIPSRWPHPALIGKRPRAVRKHALLLHDRSPGTRLEADRVRIILRHGGLQVRTASNRAPFEKNPDRLGVLHVAAHGSYHRDSWILNGIRLNDGWLGFEQLRRPETRDSLMYFGSCESGLGSELPGAEMGGWMSAGLGAGARELVLSLWKIDDESAMAFAEAFYPLWCRGMSVTQAAQRARGAVYARSPHPFSWAPFLAVG